MAFFLLKRLSFQRGSGLPSASCELFCSATLSTKENLANSRDRQSPFALPNSTIPPTSVTLVTSVTSGKITNFVEKNAIENVYFFFTYERCRRRLSLIKMINGLEEVFVIQRGKGEYEDFLYPVNHLNQRKSPSANS